MAMQSNSSNHRKQLQTLLSSKTTHLRPSFAPCTVTVASPGLACRPCGRASLHFVSSGDCRSARGGRIGILILHMYLERFCSCFSAFMRGGSVCDGLRCAQRNESGKLVSLLTYLNPASHSSHLQLPFTPTQSAHVAANHNNPLSQIMQLVESRYRQTRSTEIFPERAASFTTLFFFREKKKKTKTRFLHCAHCTAAGQHPSQALKRIFL